MKNIYFTCGPSQLYPTVSGHIKTALKEEVASMSHRSKKFEEIFSQTQDRLRKLLKIPRSCHIFFLSSSLEVMERLIESCVEKQSAHFVSGSFSKKWMETAMVENKKVKLNKEAELICVTHNETSTGESLQVKSINQLDEMYPGSLIAVDMVSSAPNPKLDFTKIDLAFFSVQKGFGLPAGLSVLIAGEKAIRKSELLEQKRQFAGGYHSFKSLLEKEKIFQTPETPNVLGIYLLGKVCEDMLKVGIARIRKETEIKAKNIYDFFDKHPKYKPEVKDHLSRSKTTINIAIGKDKSKLMKKLEARGLIVSSGYGKFKETHIRIANFPAHSIKQIQKLLNTIGYN